MTPRTRSAVLWGLVGTLSFLVLVQGYRLLVGTLNIGFGATAAVAVLVGLVVTATAYATEHRLSAKGRT
ncbi:hypothetical protein NDI76_03025 [Halogeometricum sp. S1BR25-6]|uniref:DUF7981 domain-containing protein n=1 Tax=Halogeometricum salsisoli TaxID=2950536 RepID=A0ABU2GAA6_9EURY|nr:hypothetical protein [Halogeometricum sp. S1BR25-6]MDS0297712.1 hypothetical protein [Halogeometricum sp. S1BR25-6]